MPDLPVLQTRHLRLRILNEHSAAAVLDYYSRNRAFHQPWFASRSDNVFTLQQQQANLAVEYSEFLAGRAVPFWLARHDDPNRIIGRFAFTNIVRGCFHSCFAAYHLDQDCQGQGLAAEAGQAAIHSIFNDFGLHRIEANIMPGNQRSQALASRLGFRIEGFSARYLEINGRWEDHQHWVLLSDDLKNQGQTAAIVTENLLIRPLSQQDIPLLMQYHQRNRDQAAFGNPLPVADFNSEGAWHRYFAEHQFEASAGHRLNFDLFLPDKQDWLAGTLECKNIAPLPYSSCEIGFSIDHLLSGRGLMLEALSAMLNWLFARFGFQRVTARHVAGHDRSQRLLDILGFKTEGIERQAIWLNEQWQDVVSKALLRSEFLNL